MPARTPEDCDHAVRRRLRLALLATALVVPVARPSTAAVVGACTLPGRVRISDLITAVNILLGTTPLEACRSLDVDDDGVVAVNELVLAVLYALGALPVEGPRCGDDVLDADEDCDDGDRFNGDGCSSDCRFEGAGILDQHWSGYRGGCGGSSGGTNAGALGPLAQEFVPQVNAITTVLVDAVSAADGASSRLRLNIRRGTFDGPLLGWTTAYVKYPPTSMRQNWVRFDLPVPVAVTPGEVYVLELVGYDDGLLLVSAGGNAPCEREYLPGDPVSHGERIEGVDLLFAVFGTMGPGAGAIDQAWQGPQGICASSGGLGSPNAHTLAQTFTPTIDALAAVAVPLGAVAGTAVPAGTLTLRLREGGPTGAVLATVPRFLTAPAEGEAWYAFPLSPPLAVTPGATYAIQLSDDVARFVWTSSRGIASPGCPELDLPGGEAFSDGAPLELDFHFATFAPLAP